MDISSMLEVQVNEVKETDSKENVTPRDLVPSTTREPPPISQDESNFYRIMFGNDIASVRFRKLHCTACDVHIGSAPSQAHNMCEHPMLRVLLCAKCREFYGDGSFEQGDDATDMFCRWCANGGNLYCCSYCSNTFCYKCIRRNFDSLVRKKIEADEKWKCFVCNPADLYSARAVCWALLQHIQTVTRILHNDMKMSPEEVEEKMNLDEAQCCLRKQQKRKRGRLSSKTSEDEDETYVPGGNDMPIVTKRKVAQKIQYKRRLKERSRFYDIMSQKSPYIIPQYIASNDEDTSESNTNEQFFEHDNTPATSDNETHTVIPGDKKDAVPLRLVLESSAQTLSFNKSIISPVPTASLLQRPPPINSVRSTLPSHSAILPPPPLANSTVRPDIRPCYSSTPMVSIPNPHPNMVKRARVLLPRRRTTVMVTPNIIDLDSDSDEPVVLDADKDNDTVDPKTRSHVPMPVALVSSGISNDMEKDQPLRELCTTLKKSVKTFTESVLLPQSREIETVIKNLKVKFCRLYQEAKNEANRQGDTDKTLVTVKQFYREIRNTIIQLSNINDKVVREYNSWKRSKQIQEGNEVHDRNGSTERTPTSTIEIPLDMTCVNAAESDIYEETVDKIIEPSELVDSTNVLEDILFRKSKDKIDSAVGDHSILYEDKSVQAYDVVSKDYEKSIGYSLLMKANYNPETESSVFEPVVIPNEHFGKYQEQFIYYLQHIEDHGIKTVESEEGVSDPNEIDSITSDIITVEEITVEEHIETVEEDVTEEIVTEEIVTEEGGTKNTPSLTPEILNETDTSVTINPCEPMENEKEDTDSPTCNATSNVTSTAVEQLVKMVTELANNLSDNENSVTQPDNTTKDENWPGKYSKEETVIAVKALNELLNKQEDSITNSPNSINNKSCTENEEDCTIIDD